MLLNLLYCKVLIVFFLREIKKEMKLTNSSMATSVNLCFKNTPGACIPLAIQSIPRNQKQNSMAFHPSQKMDPNTKMWAVSFPLIIHTHAYVIGKKFHFLLENWKTEVYWGFSVILHLNLKNLVVIVLQTLSGHYTYV